MADLAALEAAYDQACLDRAAASEVLEKATDAYKADEGNEELRRAMEAAAAAEDAASDKMFDAKKARDAAKPEE